MKAMNTVDELRMETSYVPGVAFVIRFCEAPEECPSWGSVDNLDSCTFDLVDLTNRIAERYWRAWDELARS